MELTGKRARFRDRGPTARTLAVLAAVAFNFTPIGIAGHDVAASAHAATGHSAEEGPVYGPPYPAPEDIAQLDQTTTCPGDQTTA